MITILPAMVGGRNLLTVSVGGVLAVMYIAMMSNAFMAELHHYRYGIAMWIMICLGASGLAGYFLPRNRSAHSCYGVQYGSAVMLGSGLTLAALIWLHRHDPQAGAVSFHVTKQLALQTIYALLITIPYACLEYTISQAPDDGSPV